MYMATRQQGFTLMEIFVVMFIISAMTLVTLANYRQFSRVTALERGAQLVALLLRDAEIRAFTVRHQSGNFTREFGLHINKSLNPRQYILFVDAIGVGTDKFYDPGTDTVLDSRLLDNNVRIIKLCENRKASNPGPSDCTFDQLSITFERPSPNVTVFGKKGGGPADDLGTGDFEIEIETNDTLVRRCVLVWTTGAVSIESGAC